MNDPKAKLPYANGLHNATVAQCAAVWTLSFFHAIHDILQTVLFNAVYRSYDEKTMIAILDHARKSREWNEVEGNDKRLNDAADAVFKHMGHDWDKQEEEAVKKDIKEYLQELRPGRLHSLDKPRPDTFTDFLRMWKYIENQGTTVETTWQKFGDMSVGDDEPKPRHDIKPVMAEFYNQYGTLAITQGWPAALSLPEKPHASWLRFGIGATAITSIPQGVATYAAVFGLGLLCNTYIGGLAGAITHGVLAGVVGAWFSDGRAFSGLATGALIGAGVFALQTYGMQVLAGLLPSLSGLELHLVAGAATILGTFLFGSIGQVITRKTGEHELFGRDYLEKVSYKTEYPLLYEIDKSFETLKERCIGGDKSSLQFELVL